MRKRTIRALLAAVVLAAGSAYFVDLATGSVSAATAPTTLTDQQRHVIDGYHADRMVVDGVHQRLLIADDVAHRVLSVGYDGTAAAEVALPGGANAGDLHLSADSSTLWAALPDAKLIISWNASTLEEIARYPVAVLDLGHVALAGGRVWFTYDKNYFASLDPATGEVVTYTIGTGLDSSASSLQPLIAVSPVDPNRLALTHAGGRPSVLVYDISGGTPALVARTQTGTVSAPDSLAYTADGEMIYVGGYGGVFYTWADEPDVVASRTISMNRAADVEAASNGWIAAASVSADLNLYKPAETTPAREFDFPASGATADLAWQPGADRLFAVTADQAGVQSLWTIDQPTFIPSSPAPERTPTAIRLEAPATAGPGSGINLLGTLTGDNLPMGTPVTVTRTDAESPAGVVLHQTTNARGAFGGVDFPAEYGTITYTAVYAGDATHRPSSAKISVQIVKWTPTLTLNRNGTVNAYGATVTMTAHLRAGGGNKTVEIWADPYGSDQPRRLLKKGTVDSAGNLSVSYRLTRNTSFSAVYAGGGDYAARTVTSTLRTRVAVSAVVGNHYRTVGSYRYIRKAKNPTITTKMTPYPGRKQKLILEKYSGGKWVAWKVGFFKLSSTGRYTFTLTGAHKTGVKYRVRAAYLTGTSGDSAAHTTYGAWKYFTFTR